MGLFSAVDLIFALRLNSLCSRFLSASYLAGLDLAAAFMGFLAVQKGGGGPVLTFDFNLDTLAASS